MVTPAADAGGERTADAVRQPKGQSIAVFVGRYGALIALVALLAAFSLASSDFFGVDNLLQILNQAALGAIVAGGLTIVLASGHFDLSIGYMASLAGVLTATLMAHGIPIPLAILASVAAGGAVGLFNGFLVTRLDINALVATLGTGSVLVGLNYLITAGVPTAIAGDHPEFLDLAIGDWLGVPRPVYYMAIVMFVLWVTLNKSDLGRNIRAVGGNVEAAMLSGVRVARVVTAGFVIAGVCAAVTGVLLAATIGSGQPTGGDNYTLTSFAAAFVGSTVLREGEFHIVGTLVGGITVAAGFNGLALIGVPSFVQFLFQGLLLIAAVALSSGGRRWSRR